MEDGKVNAIGGSATGKDSCAGNMAGRIELSIHYKLTKPAATPKGDVCHGKNGSIEGIGQV